MAAKRVPPSAEQVLETLQRRHAPDNEWNRDETDLAERMLPWDAAVLTVQMGLHTTKACAATWLENAALSSPDLFIVQVQDNGAVGSILVRNDGRWPDLGPPDGTVWGGPGDVDLQAQTRGRLAPDGGFLPKDATGPHARPGWWIVTRTAWDDHLGPQWEQESQADIIVRVAGDIVQDEAFRGMHPTALPYVGGLLDLIGSRQELTPSVFGDRAVLTVSFTGDQIDRFADLLRQWGVAPRPEPPGR